MKTKTLIQSIPKVELHLHIEGTLEPELMWRLAKKHELSLPFDSIQEIANAYQFDNLQSFLDLYYQGAAVLIDEDDFFELMWAYFLRCKEQNIVHTEIMFDPQTHTHRGIDYSVFMPGFLRAKAQAESELGITSCLILSFLRHLSQEDALLTLAQAEPYYDAIDAVGLDSSELGNPPDKFIDVFAKAKTLGFKRVAHAGEEGPPEYIWSALNDLDVHRIDHGVRCIEDPKLMAHLVANKMPLTVCPQSNLKLCVVNDMSEHNILDLLEQGVMVTVNSDDPSYFGGYLNQNYQALDTHLAMSDEQFIQLVKNSFEASFLSDKLKQKWIKEVDKLNHSLSHN
ncbi:adenosine deaminase [Alteromonas sp. 5E99-2]|uniref:adenosine deaminase n=1 Tax=Alteromonas sp. 5E99-2 TaxID=2817683 RepID=UPI001A989E5F|nr:adenosine deaminase [Alteromonas sp. 5E99-2]MBO1255697.1 adenosine deaminase [Alteromonas sp. 5E99-2]